MVEEAVTVTTLGLVNGDLIIIGTGENDHLIVTGTTGALSVQVNGSPGYTFAANGRIRVHGLGGHDDLQVAGNVALSAWLYGGMGDDRLKGGDGNDVLLGGPGDDLLVGGNGRDMLIGGTGADRIVGNADDDLLIAGFTQWDGNQAALGAILAEWTRTNRGFQERVDQIMAGCGPDNAFALNTATVGDDSDEDVLTGSSGQDWFLFNRDKDGVVKDKVTDLSTFEAMFAQDIDFIYGW
jgi:Ca2+-binding RTX toxin-like protein